MRICIPIETDKGKAAMVYGHFGSAPYFIIYDSEKDSFQIINNSNQHHTHGTCQPMGVLNRKNIDVVVCVGMGARAVLKLNEVGIQAYKAAAGTAEEIIEKYKLGKLEKITVKNACTSHSCH